MTRLDTPFRIGCWTVKPADGMIENGNESRRLQPRVMQVLCRLADDARTVVPRETLLADVWEGRAMSDEPLHRCIAELRSALGDDCKNSHVIETVPRRGYRLLLAKREAGKRGFWRWRIGASVLLLGLVAAMVSVWQTPMPPADKQLRILVLPFEMLSEVDTDRLLADALTEELIHTLTSNSELFVLSRTTTFSYRDAAVPFATLVADTNADLVVEGAVRMDDSTVRLTVQLIDSASSLHLLSRAFEQPRHNAAEMLPQVATSIGHMLDKSVADKRHRRSFTLYRDFIEARFLYESWNQHDVRSALERAKRVLTTDPDADVHALLAAIYLKLHWIDDDRPNYLSVATEHVDRALVLDPHNARAIAIQARLKDSAVENERGMRRALELDPALDDVRLDLANLLARNGFLEKAGLQYEYLLARDPLNSRAMAMMASIYCSLGRHDQYEEMIRRLQRHRPKAASLAQLRHALHGDADNLKAHHVQSFLQENNLPIHQLQAYIASIEMPQFREQAWQELQALEQDGRVPLMMQFLLWTFIAEPKKALEIFAGLEQERNSPRLQYWFWADYNQSLRKLPGFAPLLQRHRVNELLAEHGSNDFCKWQNDLAYCR